MSIGFCKNKSIFSFILVVIIISSILTLVIYPYSNRANGQDSAPVPLVFNKYFDPESRISIEYPEGWQKLDQSFLNRLRTNTSVPSPIIAFAPLDKSVGVGVIVDSNTDNMTLDLYAENNTKSLQKSQPGIKLIQSSNTSLGGSPALKLVYKGQYDIMKSLAKFGLSEEIGSMFDFKPFTVNSIMFVTLHDNKAYGIMYEDLSGALVQLSGMLGDSPLGGSSASTTEHPFTYYLPIAQRMVDSFKIGESATEKSSDSPKLQGGLVLNVDPCQIIKLRLANGSITSMEYENLKKTLECSQ